MKEVVRAQLDAQKKGGSEKYICVIRSIVDMCPLRLSSGRVIPGSVPDHGIIKRKYKRTRRGETKEKKKSRRRRRRRSFYSIAEKETERGSSICF